VTSAQFMCRTPAAYADADIKSIILGKAKARAPLPGTNREASKGSHDDDHKQEEVQITLVCPVEVNL
jgi:hypothetical protein